MKLYSDGFCFEIKDKINLKNYIDNFLEEKNLLLNIVQNIFNCETKKEDHDYKYIYIPFNNENLQKLTIFSESTELLNYFSSKIKSYKLDINLDLKNSFISLKPKIENNMIEIDFSIFFRLENNHLKNPIDKLKDILNKKSLNVELTHTKILLPAEYVTMEIIEKLISKNLVIKILVNNILIKEGIYE